MSEFWDYAQTRKRTTYMVLTSGLVMDYARVLFCIINPAFPHGISVYLLRWNITKI